MTSSSSDDDEFTWGKPKKVISKERQYYRSALCHGEEYSLNDCVVVYDEKEPTGHVAKIMKLWQEISSGNKMAQLRWFLRPSELPPELPSTENPKELFLAFGKGKGVINENRLDCISMKCKVLCTSKDERNKQPSEEDLQDADYIFNKIYNVDRMRLSNVEVVLDILGHDVFFNKPEWVSSGSKKMQVKLGGSSTAPTMHHPPCTSQKGLALQPVAEGGQHEEVIKKGVHNDENLKLEASPTEDTGKHKVKRAKVSGGIVLERENKINQVNIEGVQDVLRQSRASNLQKSKLLVTKHEKILSDAIQSKPPQRFLPAARLSNFGESAAKSWDANLEEGLSLGRVLHINNIDPSFTSADLQDLFSCYFPGLSDAQVMPQGYDSNGEALVIFETETLAESAFQELEENCLVLTDSRRPLIASRVKHPEQGKAARFPGHFPLDNFKLWKQRQDEVMRRSLASSHFPEQNTVEFEMAMEWENLRKVACSSWNQLYKLQRVEMNALGKKFRRRDEDQVQ